MIVQKKSVFPAGIDAVFQKLQQLETLQYIAWPYANFEPIGEAVSTHLLMALGYPVRPAGDEKSLEPGPLNTMVRLVIYWMSRTRLGALCTTEHCRHAPGEMEDLDRAFMSIRKREPDFPMPAFDRLKKMMPSWEQIRENYAG